MLPTLRQDQAVGVRRIYKKVSCCFPPGKVDATHFQRSLQTEGRDAMLWFNKKEKEDLVHSEIINNNPITHFSKLRNSKFF